MIVFSVSLHPTSVSMVVLVCWISPSFISGKCEFFLSVKYGIFDRHLINTEDNLFTFSVCKILIKIAVLDEQKKHTFVTNKISNSQT